MRQVCPLCADDEFVTSVPLGPGIFDYVCTATHLRTNGAFEWQGTAEAALGSDEAHEGLAVELEMKQQLLACLVAGEPWMEYGVIESRYAESNPADFARLLDVFGHRILGPVRNPRFTASAYISMILGQLRGQGDLVSFTAKATGPWAYNGTLQYWAKVPGAPKSEVTTFVDWQNRRK